MRLILFFAPIFFLWTSCIKEAVEEDFAPKFVVEGVIEEGGYAQVKVTHNIPMGYIIDQDQLEQLIVRWAKVRVYTDMDEEVLTLVRDETLFPYYFYQGRSLQGRAGETYRLEVVYNEEVLHSETTIPRYKPQLDTVGYRRVSDTDVVPYVRIVNDQLNANYLLYSRYQKQQHFFSTSPKGFKATDKTPGLYTAELLRGHALLDTTVARSHYYSVGDTVDIKVANVSEHSRQLWSAYTQQSVQFSFLNYSSNFQGNIQGDAIGIWYGANSAIGRVVVK